MTTMFDGNRKQVMNRLEKISVRDFLERLLVDDVVDQIVSSGTILVIEWTSAVQQPCGLIGFGILRDRQTLKNVYFAGASDSIGGSSRNLRSVPCERKKTGISVDELIDWIRPLNSTTVECWIDIILESREQFVGSSERAFLPLRFSYLSRRISSAIS